MTGPTTYAEWSDCIDAFETGTQDDEIVSAMSQGTLSWTSGVANLFSERIGSAFSVRLRRCADRMERDFKSGSDETTVVRAMLDTRRTLTLLYRVATVPVFPEILRQHLTAEIRDYAERAQQSLEDSAKHDRSGRLASLLRNNSLLRYQPEPPVAPAVSAAPVESVAPPTVDKAKVATPPAAPSKSADGDNTQPEASTSGQSKFRIAAGAATVCLLAGATWYVMQRPKVPAPSESSAIVVSAPPKVAAPQLASAPSPTPVTTPTPSPITPAPESPKSTPILESPPAKAAPVAEPARVSLKRPTEVQRAAPSSDDSSASRALAAIVDEGESCFEKKKFDCAISAANSALRIDHGHAKAAQLKRRAETEQRRALDSISIN